MNRFLPPHEVVLGLMSRSPMRVRMAAVLYDAHGLFSWGWNHDFVHAEEHCVMRANPARVSRATLVIAGERAKNGNAVLARPCTRQSKNCLELLKRRGVRCVIYRNKAARWVTEKIA